MIIQQIGFWLMVISIIAIAIIGPYVCITYLADFD